MVVASGQQYNVGEIPVVMLYTYINYHAGTPKQRQEKADDEPEYKATSYAVRKMISENGFSDNQFSNRSFPSTRSYLHSLSK